VVGARQTEKIGENVRKSRSVQRAQKGQKETKAPETTGIVKVKAPWESGGERGNGGGVTGEICRELRLAETCA